ncbi:MAG: hypothetical protein U5K69_30015 [Balneolaceae bacterium]|nr:hypothetical protein [Balneolaceae bacterium]
MRWWLVILVLYFLLGCSKPYEKTLDSEPNTNTGTVEIKLSRPLSATITISEKLVMEGERTSEIIFNNVPLGEHNITIVGSRGYSNTLDTTFTVKVRPGKKTTKVIGSPDFNAGRYFLTFVIPVGIILLVMN